MHHSVNPQPIRLEDNERQRCEVWTRVMGYHRPVSSFNPGKQSEHAERLPFVETSSLLEGKRACCS
ncbi:MAG: oxidoreductase [Candidatus Thiothrix moscowensis]|nr:oxidoreductase [Candidatus Thiothrix moscowensis]